MRAARGTLKLGPVVAQIAVSKTWPSGNVGMGLLGGRVLFPMPQSPPKCPPSWVGCAQSTLETFSSGFRVDGYPLHERAIYKHESMDPDDESPRVEKEHVPSSDGEEPWLYEQQKSKVAVLDDARLSQLLA